MPGLGVVKYYNFDNPECVKKYTDEMTHTNFIHECSDIGSNLIIIINAAHVFLITLCCV